jgi:hyperosmotically inducible protein
MKPKAILKVVPGVLLGVALAVPVFAQSTTQSMKDAGHSTGNAVSNAWHSTKAAVSDTDITAKVKIALHNDKLTKGRDIHVDTHDGTVTLTGYAPKASAARAVWLARGTTGVTGVNDNLRGSESMSSR